MESPEIWVPVTGYEGIYEVSTLGRVRSLDRLVMGPKVLRKIPGRVLIPTPDRKGHLCVSLSVGGIRAVIRVHRLVALAFVPNPENLPLVLHFDDVKSNNTVGNLRWGTVSDNGHDATRNGKNHYANRTQCGNGHDLIGDNVILRKGARVCRACQLARQRESYRRSKQRETTGISSQEMRRRNGL